MNQSKTASDFFYNFIPGTIFIIILVNTINIPVFDEIRISIAENIKSPNLVVGSFLAIVGTMCGFLFQEFTAISRRYLGINNYVFCRIINKLPQLSEIAKRHIKLKLGHGNQNIVNDNTIFFFLMHNWILSVGYGEQSLYFRNRLAIWSNVMWAALTLFVLDYLTNSYGYTAKAFLLFVIIFSLVVSIYYLTVIYDVVLKTFVVIKALDDKK